MSEKNGNTNQIDWKLIIAIIALSISFFVLFYGSGQCYQKTSLPWMEPILTRICPQPSPTSIPPQSAIALADTFDGTSRSYDTVLWTCLKDSECNIESIFLQDGILNLRTSGDGFSDLLSHSAWDYDKIGTLSGKIQISKSLYQGGESWTWISLHYFTTCNLSGSESPNIYCEVGSDFKGDLKYRTDKIPVNFDTWYSIKIDFNHNTNTIKFHLGNEQIGQYVLTETPETVQVSVGIYSLGPSQTYIDDVLLTLTK